MESKSDARETVMSYIRSLDSKDYNGARDYLNEGVRIIGPAGESFREPEEFLGMLRQYQGKYDVKKVFADGDDVCLLYDLMTPGATVFMCSWYQVKNRRIVSIRTVFDPSKFGPSPGKKG